MSGYVIYISLRKMDEIVVNSEDPDQTPQNAASDLGLYCLPNTLLGVSRLQRDNQQPHVSLYYIMKTGVDRLYLIRHILQILN